MPRHIVCSRASSTGQPRHNPRALPGPKHGLPSLNVHPVEPRHHTNWAKTAVGFTGERDLDIPEGSGKHS
eukprot:12928706-Prorocentrum_lima.AAC.1